jgi:hypothetical protein
MGIAESMKDVIVLEEGALIIVDCNSCALGQDPDGIQGLATPFRMDFIVNQPLGAGGMQPLDGGSHSGPGLIVVRDRFLLGQMLFDRLIDLRHLLGCHLASFHYGAFTERLAV